MTRPFLTACWSNLCLVTYKVDPQYLKLKIPDWLEPDLRDGHAFVSLVAFEFLKTKVWGVSWPGFRDFPEINLRVYVRHGDKRGVFFIREFVPQPTVAWLARSLYNEPYLAVEMGASVRESDNVMDASYYLQFGGVRHTLNVRATVPSLVPAEDSNEHFFKEHRWGFGKTRSGKPLIYEVDHPVWEIFPIKSVALELDWKLVYGDDWSFLQDAEPYSTVLARGSEIAVFPAQALS